MIYTNQKNIIQDPDDINIMIFIHIILNKMNINNRKQYDFFEVCNILYKHSHKIDNINNIDISDTVENLFKTIKTENIWKIFVILNILAELSSERVDIFYQYNIYFECKKHNIYNWNDAKISLKDNIDKMTTKSDIEKVSNIFIGYLFAGIESMAYYGNKDFSLYQSESAINEWITGFGNFVEYNNSISILFDDIDSYPLRDEIMDKFKSLLILFYKVELNTCKNKDETYNWEQVSEIVCSGLL
jgi:hypothetical protein